MPTASGSAIWSMATIAAGAAAGFFYWRLMLGGGHTNQEEEERSSTVGGGRKARLRAMRHRRRVDNDGEDEDEFREHHLSRRSPAPEEEDRTTRSSAKKVQFDFQKTEAHSPPPSRRESSEEQPQRKGDTQEKHVLEGEEGPGAAPSASESLGEAVNCGRNAVYLLSFLQREDAQAQVNSATNARTGHTLLHECAMHLAAGQEPFLNELLNLGWLDVNAPDCASGSMTALHLACAAGKEAIAKCFIQRLPLASLTQANPSGWTALHFLAAKNRAMLIAALFQRVEDEESEKDNFETFYQRVVDPVTDVGFTPLLLALKAKAAEAASVLVSAGADVHVTSKADRNGTTLHLTMLTGYPMYRVAAQILEKEPSLGNALDLDGRNPLHWSLQRGHGRMSLLLLTLGRTSVEVGDKVNRVTPLHLVATANDMGILQAIFATSGNDEETEATTTTSKSDAEKKQIDLEVKDVSGRTPLIAAAILGSDKAINFLAEKGANVSAADDAGISALHWALKNRRKAAAMKLLEYQCDVDCTDLHGNTPLLIACYNGRQFASVAELLCDRCPEDVSKADKEGRTPLHWAAAHGHSQLCTALLDAGASSAAVESENGVVPMHWAAREAQYDAVELLYYDATNVQDLSPEEACNVRDRKGRTPLHWLCQRLADDASKQRKAREASSEDNEDAEDGDGDNDDEDDLTGSQQLQQPIPLCQAKRVLVFLLTHEGDLHFHDSYGVDQNEKEEQHPPGLTPLGILESEPDLKEFVEEVLDEAATRKQSFHQGGAFGGGAFGNHDGGDEAGGLAGAFTAFGCPDAPEDGEDSASPGFSRSQGTDTFSGTPGTPPRRRATGYVAFSEEDGEEEKEEEEEEDQQ